MSKTTMWLPFQYTGGTNPVSLTVNVDVAENQDQTDINAAMQEIVTRLNASPDFNISNGQQTDTATTETSVFP